MHICMHTYIYIPLRKESLEKLTLTIRTEGKGSGEKVSNLFDEFGWEKRTKCQHLQEETWDIKEVNGWQNMDKEDW